MGLNDGSMNPQNGDWINAKAQNGQAVCLTSELRQKNVGVKDRTIFYLPFFCQIIWR